MRALPSFENTQLLRENPEVAYQYRDKSGSIKRAESARSGPGAWKEESKQKGTLKDFFRCFRQEVFKASYVAKRQAYSKSVQCSVLRSQSRVSLTFPQGKFKLPNSARRWAPVVTASNGLESAQAGGCSDRRTHSPILTMTDQQVSYTLDSTLETVDSAEQAASRMATEAGFDDEDVMRISMAVREAAVNAVLHGNAYDPDKKVSLGFERTGKTLVITIRDQGKGLDLKKLPDPLAPENLLKTSGRGIFLIRSFMDEVQIHPSQTGTEIKLIKNVPGPTAGGKEASQ